MTSTTDPQALRDRIAEALIAWTYRGKDPEHGGILETVRANAYSRADAVLAVLQTATLRELEQLHRPNTTPSRPELRRLAAERVRDAADRSRLLLWAADRLERMPGYPRLVLPEELLTELRRLAAEPTANTDCPSCDAGIPHDAHCPTPETHNWGCGCPTDDHPAALGTLPAWLYQRFMPGGVGWERLDGDDRSYWEHQARAVRRAVARGGFRPEAAQSVVVEQPDTQTREARP